MKILEPVGDVAVDYVNDSLYESLANFVEQIESDTEITDAAPDSDILRLLFLESRLLDEKHFEIWMELFSHELIYWVPMIFGPQNPKFESSIYLDDRRRLGDRVGSILTGSLHAQIPPSRTRRMLTNIEQRNISDNEIWVRANLVIWEYRKHETRSYPGTQEYQIVRESGKLLIRTKVVRLLNSDSPQGNYSFIL
ncbi:MAG: 3-phenylpropionate/cinnamic acid dioxygenase small subunit [Gammaproteobacteria bacterium]|jgi:3-phenylpropionate/cinnamic acid dioxygenase small subunit